MNDNNTNNPSTTLPRHRKGGRPRKDPRLRMRPQSFSLFPKQIEFLKEESARRGISVSKLMQEILLGAIGTVQRRDRDMIRERARERLRLRLQPPGTPGSEQTGH